MRYLLARQANLLGALALALDDRLNKSLTYRGRRSLSSTAALIHLRLNPGETIDSLSRVLGLSHSATVRLVDRLEADGLAERRSGADRRSVGLFVTHSGEAAAVKALHDRHRVFTDALAPLSAGERKQLTALVEKLLVGLVSDGWSALQICRLCDVPACNRGAYCPIDLSQPKSIVSLSRRRL